MKQDANENTNETASGLSVSTGYTICFKRVVAKGISSGGSNRDVWLSHEMRLPFIPPIGMEVCDGDEWSFVVKELCYKDGVIFAFDEREKPRVERTDGEMAEMVKEEIECGWKASDGILSV